VRGRSDRTQCCPHRGGPRSTGVRPDPPGDKRAPSKGQDLRSGGKGARRKGGKKGRKRDKSSGDKGRPKSTERDPRRWGEADRQSEKGVAKRKAPADPGAARGQTQASTRRRRGDNDAASKARPTPLATRPRGGAVPSVRRSSGTVRNSNTGHRPSGGRGEHQHREGDEGGGRARGEQHRRRTRGGAPTGRPDATTLGPRAVARPRAGRAKTHTTEPEAGGLDVIPGRPRALPSTKRTPSNRRGEGGVREGRDLRSSTQKHSAHKRRAEKTQAPKGVGARRR
ncbi:unnamed protein product, partial [Amoebophrya sp. A120]